MHKPTRSALADSCTSRGENRAPEKDTKSQIASPAFPTFAISSHSDPSHRLFAPHLFPQMEVTYVMTPAEWGKPIDVAEEWIHFVDDNVKESKV